MSDEESFVILGSSPQSFMSHYSQRTPTTPRQELSLSFVDANKIDVTPNAATTTENDHCQTDASAEHKSVPAMETEMAKIEKSMRSAEDNDADLRSQYLSMGLIKSPMTSSGSFTMNTTPSPISTSISLISLPTGSTPCSMASPKETTDALIENGTLQRDGPVEISAEMKVDPQPSSATTLSNSASSIKENIKAEANTRMSETKLAEPSLAASFILGEINADDVLRNSVYSQFPSICSMPGCAEDVVKLQNLLTEYMELKITLTKVNSTMRAYYDRTQQWKADMQRVEQEYKRQSDEMKTQIAALRNENIELKREINDKLAHIQVSEECRQKDQVELMQEISSKTAQINNMSRQIEKLEQHQLSSYEYVPKNEDDTKEKPDYIDRQEHNRLIKELERKMSEHVAENFSLRDVQAQYIDEINCLKVNLTAAEELINQSRADIALLKAKDQEKSEMFSTYEEERNRMREELALLRQQVDVYSKDFEMERIARETLAGEKDNLLQDLRILQRKNHELIEDAQRQLNSNRTSFKASSPSPATSTQQPIRQLTHPTTTNFLASNADTHRCPVCSKACKSLALLQSHVNMCLDNI